MIAFRKRQFVFSPLRRIAEKIFFNMFVKLHKCAILGVLHSLGGCFCAYFLKYSKKIFQKIFRYREKKRKNEIDLLRKKRFSLFVVKIHKNSFCDLMLGLHGILNVVSENLRYEIVSVFNILRIESFAVKLYR